MVKYYRKQPIEAIQWRGDNQNEVHQLASKAVEGCYTANDADSNLHVAYWDKKGSKHLALVPKFGWVVVEGKMLQFYTDDTFRRTFKAAEASEGESAGIDWGAMDKNIEDFFETFDKDKLFRGFHGVSKEKIQDYVNKKASEDEVPKDDDKSEPSILDLARQADKVSYKRLMEILDKDFEDNYQAMLDKWLETLPSDANKLQKYAVNEKDVESDTFDSVLDEMKELHAKKNKDYKGSFHDLFKEYGMPYALGHLEEKLNRVKAITENGGNAVKNDHIEDSVIDLACYAVMLYVELKNKKNGTDKD